MNPYRQHLFICTHVRPDSTSCGSKGAEALRAAVKSKAPKDCRVNAAGCLGFCEKGIAAVVYPQGQWFHDLKNDGDAEEVLLQSLKERSSG